MAALIDSSTKKASKDNTSSLTTDSFTVAGSNRVLYVLAYSGAGSAVVATAAKWGGSGGTSMTKIADSGIFQANGYASLWRLIAPTAQTSTVYVDWGTAQDERLIIAVSVKDADQTTPNGTVASANFSGITPSQNATAVVGDLVLNFLSLLGGNSDPKTLTAGKTSLQEIEGTEGGALDGYECAGAQYTTAASTSQAMNWSIAGDGSPASGWVWMFSLAINAASGGGGVTVKSLAALGVG